MKKLLFLFLLFPVLAFGQSTGKIMSNRSSNATLPVDTINVNTKINLLQTTAGVTLTFPDKTTTSVSNTASGSTVFLNNIGSASVTIAVSGSSNFTLAINQHAILNWVGSKWTVLYIGSGAGAFLPLAGGTMTGDIAITSPHVIKNTSAPTNLIKIDTKKLSIKSDSAVAITAAGGFEILTVTTPLVEVRSALRVYSDLSTQGPLTDFSNVPCLNPSSRILSNTSGTSALKWGSSSNGIELVNIPQFTSAFLKNTNLTGSRTFEFPDASGTLALLTSFTASNGLTRSTNDFQLGGLLSSNTTITGGSSRSLTLGSVGSKLTDFVSNTSNSVFLRANNAQGVLELDAGLSGIYHTNSSTGVNASIEGNDSRAYMNWDDGTHPTTISTDINGIGLNTVNGGFTGYFKTSRILTSNRTIQLPDSSGTLALTSNLGAYMPLLAPNDVGIKSSAGGPVGEYVPHRSTSYGGPPWNNMRTYSIGGGSYASPDNWTQITQDPSNTYIKSKVSTNTAEIIVGSSTPSITLQTGGAAGYIGLGTTGSFAKLKTTNFTADRNFQFPDSSGTLALAESLTKYLPLSGGTMSGPIDMFGFDIIANQIKDPTGAITIIDVAGTVINDQSGNISQDFTSRQLNNTAGNPMLDYSSSSSGIGIGNAGGSSFGFIRNTLVSGGSKQYELPNANGTFALTSDIPTITASNGLTKTGNNIALGGSLTGSTTIALGSNGLTFTKSGQTLWSAHTGGLYDNSGSGIQSIDIFGRRLYDVAGVPVMDWNNSSTAGIGITRVGNNTFLAYLKNSNLTADRTFQFPNTAGTFAVTANNLSVFASTTSAQLAGVISDESGNGVVAYTISPVFTTPNIGTATGSVSGNAGTATALQTPRTINGVSFDGTGDITVPNIVTVTSDATDADYTAVVNSVKYLPSATLSTNRTITIPTGSNGDFLEIYNNETGFNWLLSGSSVYLADGTTIITSLYANTNHLIRKVSGKWRILN